MDAIAQPRAAVPEPPGFFTSLWDVFVAFLLAGIGVAAATFAAILIGAFGFTAGAERPDSIDWPYPHAGPWSVAANVVATVAVLLYTARHPRTFAYVFFLHNVSWGRVTLLGVSGTDTASFLRVARAEPGFPYPGRTARPLPGVSIHHQNEQELTLYIHTPGCAGSYGTFSLDRVHVRYRLAGVTLSQPVPLATRPTVVCP